MFKYFAFVPVVLMFSVRPSVVEVLLALLIVANGHAIAAAAFRRHAGASNDRVLFDLRERVFRATNLDDLERAALAYRRYRESRGLE